MQTSSSIDQAKYSEFSQTLDVMNISPVGTYTNPAKRKKITPLPPVAKGSVVATTTRIDKQNFRTLDVTPIPSNSVSADLNDTMMDPLTDSSRKVLRRVVVAPAKKVVEAKKEQKIDAKEIAKSFATLKGLVDGLLAPKEEEKKEEVKEDVKVEVKEEVETSVEDSSVVEDASSALYGTADSSKPDSYTLERLKETALEVPPLGAAAPAEDTSVVIPAPKKVNRGGRRKTNA